MTDRKILNAIQACDPDGQPEEPTEAAYRDHEYWAVDTYGEQAWQDYCKGGWAERSDV